MEFHSKIWNIPEENYWNIYSGIRSLNHRMFHNFFTKIINLRNFGNKILLPKLRCVQFKKQLWVKVWPCKLDSIVWKFRAEFSHKISTNQLKAFLEKVQISLILLRFKNVIFFWVFSDRGLRISTLEFVWAQNWKVEIWSNQNFI